MTPSKRSGTLRSGTGRVEVRVSGTEAGATYCVLRVACSGRGVGIVHGICAGRNPMGKTVCLAAGFGNSAGAGFSPGGTFKAICSTDGAVLTCNLEASTCEGPTTLKFELWIL